jgi:hypothetical protein
MSNFMMAKFGLNYKLKVEHIATQSLNYVANWKCT